jgi:hypothetical protein
MNPAILGVLLEGMPFKPPRWIFMVFGGHLIWLLRVRLYLKRVAASIGHMAHENHHGATCNFARGKGGEGEKGKGAGKRWEKVPEGLFFDHSVCSRPSRLHQSCALFLIG